MTFTCRTGSLPHPELSGRRRPLPSPTPPLHTGNGGHGGRSRQVPTPTEGGVTHGQPGKEGRW